MSYSSLYAELEENPIWIPWLNSLPEQLDQLLSPENNSNLPNWLNAIQSLPDISPSHTKIDSSFITVGKASDCDKQTQYLLKKQLQQLKPWRKGPFKLFDVSIDTEWRSDWKWDRLSNHITPLTGKTVLDVGCGNGYHSWRMAGCGAKLVIGIDPSLLFVMQYQTIKKYLADINVFVLPLRLENMPANMPAFDSVFSMGVLYHRRSPFDHLFELRNLLKPGGELILETLVVSGDKHTVLVPQGRYAQMNNVWFLPSPLSLISWLEKCGFINVRLVDLNQTTLSEQKSTEWMEYNSLQDYLDPEDHNLTIEGHPAPTRAIIIAQKTK